MKNWIKDYKKENADTDIKLLLKNIDKNHYELGKTLKKIKENNISLKDFISYGITEKKANQLIINYDFIEEFQITDFTISFSKISLLSKFKHRSNIKALIEEAKFKNLDELRKSIFENKDEKIITKNIKMDEDTLQIFNECSDIIKKISGEKNMTQSNVIKFILIDYYSSNLDILKDKTDEK